MAAASLVAVAVAIAAAWVAKTWKKAEAPTVPLTKLGVAGGTTPTADAAEDDEEDDLLLVADLVMLDMGEWEREDITNDCVVQWKLEWW